MSDINFIQNSIQNSFVQNNYEDLAEDIKMQMTIFELEAFFKKNSFKKSDKRELKKFKVIKSFLILIYVFLIFFEKPFWCYKRTTFWSYDSKEDNECDSSVSVLGVFLDSMFYRILELFLILSIIFIKLRLTIDFDKWSLQSNKILSIILFTSFSLCFLDIFLGLIIDFFPFINFILRSFLIILLKKSLRQEWIKIFLIIYKTRSVTFILTFIMCVFSLIGHLLFYEENNDFKSFFSSLDAMFILLTTCNYPDVMLKTFPISKFSIVFFVLYIMTNFFIFLSLLKALYYANYLEINKAKAKEIIKGIQERKYVAEEEDLKKAMTTLNNKFSFSQEEFERLKGMINMTKESLEYSAHDSFSQSYEDLTQMREHRVLKILRTKKVELIVNVSNLTVIAIALLQRKNLFNDLIQICVCLYFILEYLIYVKYYTLKKMTKNKMLRSLFCFINIILFNSLLLIIILEICDYNLLLDELINLAKSLTILRSIRLLIFLNSFQEYKIIFTTLRNMRTMFFKITATQFSFFLVFSTVSMMIIGGKVKTDQFVNSPSIPEYYHHINFNSFPSGFMTCFSLMMVNNMNIQTDALSQPVGGWLKAYFSFFYFLGFLMILNICQTYILDMYMTTKKSKK